MTLVGKWLIHWFQNHRKVDSGDVVAVTNAFGDFIGVNKHGQYAAVLIHVPLPVLRITTIPTRIGVAGVKQFDRPFTYHSPPLSQYAVCLDFANKRGHWIVFACAHERVSCTPGRFSPKYAKLRTFRCLQIVQRPHGIMAHPTTLSFSTSPLEHGKLWEFTDDELPTAVIAWRNDGLTLPAGATHFGFVLSSRCRLSCASGDFTIKSGMYFSALGSLNIEVDRDSGAAGLVVSRLGFSGVFQIGGPVEAYGRLRYIDGCSDSLLIPPSMKGDPCLNYLHVPRQTDQTPHTHPSLRVGMILRGRGYCRTPEEDRKETALRPGEVFAIRAGGLHSFHTTGEELALIAYHPDSDFGPQHDDHPMLNRTIIHDCGQ